MHLNGVMPIANLIESIAARGTRAMWTVRCCPTELLEYLPQGRVSHWALAVVAVRENELRVPCDRRHGLEKVNRLSR